jgi:hypothetical protein
VIAFSDDGAALVAGERGYLVPAGGWRIGYTRDDGTTRSEPVVAWAITRAGRVTPLRIDGDNLVMDTIDCSGRFRVYHPDSAAP